MKIIIVTPAGRRRYLKILFKYLKKQKNDFKEWHLWENSRNNEDKEYILSLEKEYDWIKCINRKFTTIVKKGTNYGISQFWDYPHNKDTIYIRFDDDIVFIEDNFIKKISQFRINNPEYAFIYGNIINNNIIDHIHQIIGALQLKTQIDYKCMGNSWRSKDIALSIHKQFINDIKTNCLEKWKFKKKELNNYKRVSINCICWRGGDMDNFKFLNTKNGTVRTDEEHLISVEQPRKMKKPAVIFGESLVSHGAFYTQRTNELEKLIQEYNNLVYL